MNTDSGSKRVGQWLALGGLVLALSISFSFLQAGVAGASWLLPPLDLSSPTVESTEPHVTIAPDGTTTVVWVESGASGFAAMASTRPPGGAFSAPETLGNSPYGIENIGVMTKYDGSTFAHWETLTGTPPDWETWQAFRPAGSSTWSAAAPNIPADGLALDYADGRDGFVQGTRFWDGSNYRVDLRAQRLGSEAQLQSTAGRDASQPRVAAASLGQPVYATWTENTGAGRILNMAIYGNGDPGWTIPIVAGDADYYNPDITVSPATDTFTNPLGTLTLIYQEWDGSSLGIQTLTLTSGVPASTQDLEVAESSPPVSQDRPLIAPGPDASATAVWVNKTGETTTIRASTRPGFDAAFSAPQTISDPANDASRPSLAVAPNGKTVIAWREWDGANQIVKARVREAGSDSFSAPQTLSGSGGNAGQPAVAVSTCPGPASVVWSRAFEVGTSTVNRVQQAGYSCPAARLGTPSVKGPRSTKAGRKTTFRVTVRNLGGTTATGVKVSARAKTAKATRNLGAISPGKSKTVALPIKFKKAGKATVSFTASSSNAGKKTVKKSVRVG